MNSENLTIERLGKNVSKNGNYMRKKKEEREKIVDAGALIKILPNPEVI
jgi:hypothetical protein